MIGEIFALLGACVISAGNVSIRRGMRRAHDSGVFISTFISAATFVLLLIILWIRRSLPPLTLLGFLLFVSAGLLTSFAGRSLHYAAIRALGPSRATSIRCSSPIVTICLAFLFLSERFSFAQFIGASAILGGVIFLTRETVGRTDLGVPMDPSFASNDSPSSQKPSFIGILYALAAALSFGTGHFLRKLALKEVPSPYWGLALGTAAAWLTLTWHAASRGKLKALWRNNFNLREPPWFFIAGGFLTTTGVLFVYLAIFFTEVSTAMVIESSEPLATLFISRLFLGREEPLNWRVMACSTSVCCGLALMIL